MTVNFNTGVRILLCICLSIICFDILAFVIVLGNNNYVFVVLADSVNTSVRLVGTSHNK